MTYAYDTPLCFWELVQSDKKMKAYNIARTKVVDKMGLRTLTELVTKFEKNDYTLQVNMRGHHERRYSIYILFLFIH